MWGQPLGSAPNTGVIVYTVGATFEPGRAPQWAVQYCEYIVLLQTFLCGDSSTMPPPPVLCTQLLWEVIFCCQIFEIIFHYFDWSPLRPGAWNWILSVSIMPGRPLPPLADISFERVFPRPSIRPRGGSTLSGVSAALQPTMTTQLIVNTITRKQTWVFI